MRCRRHSEVIGRRHATRVPVSKQPDAKESEMNKDQVKGRVEQAKGAVKEATGKAVGNDRLEAEGKVDKASGKVQSGYGDAKEKTKDAIDKL
jgi:uncharacterized protein YjbJ (UPF0337 family)